MKLLICGDRTWTDRAVIENLLRPYPPQTVVIHGAAKGADQLAGRVADEMGMYVESYPADWGKHGNAAGPIRNRKMLDQCPDLVIALHDTRCDGRGTRDTVREAKRRKIPVIVIAQSEL